MSVQFSALKENKAVFIKKKLLSSFSGVIQWVLVIVYIIFMSGSNKLSSSNEIESGLKKSSLFWTGNHLKISQRTQNLETIPSSSIKHFATAFMEAINTCQMLTPLRQNNWHSYSYSPLLSGIHLWYFRCFVAVLLNLLVFLEI